MICGSELWGGCEGCGECKWVSVSGCGCGCGWWCGWGHLCLVLLYILATPKVSIGLWQSALMATLYCCPTGKLGCQHHAISCLLMPSTRLGTDKLSFISHSLQSFGIQTLELTHGKHTLYRLGLVCVWWCGCVYTSKCQCEFARVSLCVCVSVCVYMSVYVNVSMSVC